MKMEKRRQVAEKRRQVPPISAVCSGKTDKFFGNFPQNSTTPNPETPIP
jgi:hypothetical protein